MLTQNSYFCPVARTQTRTKIVMFTVPVWNIDLVTCVLARVFLRVAVLRQGHRGSGNRAVLKTGWRWGILLGMGGGERCVVKAP